MHINLSLDRGGVNVFQDSEDVNGLSREGYYFIGGLMKHMKAVTCITNPTIILINALCLGMKRRLYGMVVKDTRTADPGAIWKRGQYKDRTAKPGCCR